MPLTRIFLPLIVSVALTACSNSTNDDPQSSEVKPLTPVETAPLAPSAPAGPTEPAAPAFNNAPTISGTPAKAMENQAYSFKPEAQDSDADALSFSLRNAPAWLALDPNTGGLSGTPSRRDVGSHDAIEIVATDGKDDSKLTFSLTVDYNPVEEAIRTGNALLVKNAEDILTATLETKEKDKNLLRDAKIRILNLADDGTAKTDGSSLTNISWNPTHDAALLGATFGVNESILYSNAVTLPNYNVLRKPLAVIGEASARYMVMGSNPMRNARRSPGSVSVQMHTFMENSLTWLMNSAELSSSDFSVVIGQLGASSGYFPDYAGTTEWLAARYANASVNAMGSCDNTDLAGCLSNATDLLIVSSQMDAGDDVSAITAAVEDAVQRGIPVLYMHHDGDENALSKALFTLFDVQYAGDNRWRRLSLQDFDPSSTVAETPDNIASIAKMLNHFKNQDYGFNWSKCDKENCSAVTDYQSEFLDGAEAVKNIMDGFDADKQDIFAQADKLRFYKLLILLADHYRQTISYPMDKFTTDDTAFLQAFYADHAVYSARGINPAQSDLGSFSRSDFSHITPTTRNVVMTSKRYFRSTGAYALPGQTLTVARTDGNAAVATTVFVNTLRAGATHMFAKNGYTRPRRLQSQRISIAPGERIQLTSPYGGPIQIGFDTNEQDVAFRFENVGEHPYWAGPGDDASFTEKMDAGDYDWAEVVSPGFEVHSTLEKLRTTLKNANWNTPAALGVATMQHLHNYPHVLAGFQGPGIDVINEIHDFAMNNGLTIYNLDQVQHMNADQASCGYGCSGNPYDAYWSFSPIGHGDIHELGHGLEKSRMRFQGSEVHSSTNPYSYFSKTQFFKQTGQDPACQKLPFKDLHDTVQKSVNAADPFQYMQDNLWNRDNWSHNIGIFIQMMMAAQDLNVFTDGWHLYARLHIIEREFDHAIKADDVWLAKRDGLGFGSFTRTDARNLSSNDFIVIAISHAAGLDYRNFISAWGQSFSAAANAQVASFSYPAVPLNFYLANEDSYCKNFQPGKHAINGSNSWPY